jgi:uncharacterized protein (DUF58 family)
MRLTPAGALFVSATGLAGIGVIAWFPGAGGALFCVLTAILAVSALAPALRPTAEHRPPDTCFAGIRAAGSVTVVNPSRIFPILLRSLTVTYREPNLRRMGLVRLAGPWAIPAGGSRTLSYPLRTLRRGRLRFEAITLEVAGTPPLWVRRWRRAAPAELTVYPRPALLRRPVPVRARGLERPLPLAHLTRRGSEEEFCGLREYVPGDSIRHIHWRTSFKLPGRLRLKEFAGSEAGHARIVLDPARPRDGGRPWRLDFERAVSAAAALWDHLDRQGMLVTLQLPRGEYCGRHMIRPMLEGLARLTSTPEPTPPPRPEPGVALFWISPNPTEPRAAHEDLFVLTPSRIDEHFQVL